MITFKGDWSKGGSHVNNYGNIYGKINQNTEDTQCIVREGSRPPPASPRPPPGLRSLSVAPSSAALGSDGPQGWRGTGKFNLSLRL